MSLITVCAIFCTLKFHVVFSFSVVSFSFMLTNRKMIKIVTRIDLHIACILTYDCWLSAFQSSIFEWVMFGDDNKFLIPNLWLCVVLFSIYPNFYSLKILLPNPFLFGASPAINNDRGPLLQSFSSVIANHWWKSGLTDIHCLLKFQW